MPVALYDGFADYDRFIRWERRLAHELPLIERLLASVDAQRVLDAACGTGVHAVALAERGYEVVGADLSAGMIERARENAARAGIDGRFIVAGFGALAEEAGGGFDALLCLGSSLPHVLTAEGLHTALADFGTALRPGGLLLVQNRNFDRVLVERARWMAPQSHREGEREWLFLRFYDFNADGTLTFHVVTLTRRGQEPWAQHDASTQLAPWQQAELARAVADEGFGDITLYGDMAGSDYDQAQSGNLVIAATRTHAGSMSMQ